MLRISEQPRWVLFKMFWLKQILIACYSISTPIDQRGGVIITIHVYNQSTKNPYFWLYFLFGSSPESPTQCSVTGTEQRRGLFHNVLLTGPELQLCSQAAQLPRLPCVMLQSPAGNARILTVGRGQSEPRELWQPAALSAAAKDGEKKKKSTEA